MSNIGKQSSKNVQQEVLTTCWQYLRENFHKFNEDKKLKVILTLCPKNMPVMIEGGSSQFVYIINNRDTKGSESNRVNLLPSLKPTEDSGL